MSVTAPAPASRPPSRKEMIAQRQENSPVWWLIHKLGSLNFALFLLATIAIGCAAATFFESGFNTKVAHTYIYKNPLFHLWLIALCVNLFAVTLTRWPWQKKHIGFVVTHYGIITLLFGAVIGMTWGFEGNVVLRKDAAPTTRITTSRSVIQIESPTDSALYLMGFDAEATKPSSKRLRNFPIPGTKLNIVADDFSPNLIREEKFVASENMDGGPAALLRFTGGMANQTLELPFLLVDGQPAEQDFFGMARIVFRSTLPEAGPPPDQETQMIFAKYAPVVQSGTAPTGVSVRLSEDGSKVTIVSAEGTGATYRRSEVMNQPINEGTAVITVETYWPDFAMKDGKPSSKSEVPNNPAALVHIVKASKSADTKPSLVMAPTADGIAYQVRRGDSVTASGTARPGDKFALGWADWQAEVVQALPKGVLVTETKPGPELEKGAHGVPGFRAHLESIDGKRGPDRWVESGQITTLTDGTNIVRVAYGLESKPVPFSIRLVDFEIPRDEGTDTPADFRASVEFKDAVTKETKTGLARMNHPASFPGTLWANITGFNYKFSQAEWNPKDLNETTLQVLYDPGWLLKWIGSLGICIGIAIMFYWKPGGA